MGAPGKDRRKQHVLTHWLKTRPPGRMLSAGDLRKSSCKEGSMFFFRFLRLLASIAWEGIFNFLFLLASLVPGRKNTMKNRMKTIMCRVRGSGLPLVLAGLLLSTIALSSGCSSCTHRPRTLGADLSETIEFLTDTTDPIEELSNDIYILFGPEWGEFMDTICRLSR